MTPTIAQLVMDTIALLEAVAAGNVARAHLLAGKVRDVGWREALPGLASAAGALQLSLEKGADSEEEMTMSVQAVAYEVQNAVRDGDGLA